MDLECWKQARDGMESIEALFEGPALSYFHNLKGRSQEFSPSNTDQNVPYNDLTNMRMLLSDWSRFRQDEERVLKFRRRGGAGQEGDRKLKRVQEDFTSSLKEFNKYLLMGARSGFVSHAYARDEKQSVTRARKILVEISEGRRYVTLSNTNHSCFQLEILHRLLIYRIWWESIGKDLFSNEEDDYVHLSLEIPEKILCDIEYDLGNMHIDRTKNARWRKEIGKSIKIFRDGGENLEEELRKRIEGFDLSFRRMQWPNEQGCIMGMPYIPDGHDVVNADFEVVKSYWLDRRMSPYRVMDPTMRHVGVNSASAVSAGAVPVEGDFFEQRTERQ
jgi:hypothetical protein